MMNGFGLLSSSVAGGEISFRGSEQEKFSFLKENLAQEFADFVCRGASLFDSTDWNPCQDVKFFMAHLSRVNLHSAWGSLLEDPSGLEEPSLREWMKGLFLEEMKNLRLLRDRELVSPTARCLVALNHRFHLCSQMEFLNALVDRWKEGAFCLQKQREILAPLLKCLIQHHLLEKGWLKNSFSWGSVHLIAFFISVLFELDESTIEEYAKECSFCFCMEDESKGAPVLSREEMESLWYPYSELCTEWYKHQKNKRDLFLKSLEEPLDVEIFKTFFASHSEFAPKEKWMDPLYLSLALSEQARGFLFFQLLVDPCEEYRDIHRDYIEQFLRKDDPISIPDWRIFLPVEGDLQKKKEMLQMVLRIIKDPKIHHPFPVAWVATLVLYLLNLKSDPKRYEGELWGRREEFGAAWVNLMASSELLPFKEEDYEVLSDAFGFLLRRAMVLEKCSENPIPILQNIFLTLDKVRLSAEGLPSTSSVKTVIERSEALMTKILNCFYDEGKKKGAAFNALFPPHLVNALFRPGLTVSEIKMMMECMKAVDAEIYPLFRPFLRSVGAFQKGGALSTKSL